MKRKRTVVFSLILLSFSCFAKPAGKFDLDTYEKAIYAGDLKKVSHQIKLGAPVNHVFDIDDIPTSPLVYAIRKGNYELYQLLIAKGADPNGPENGYIPLIVAIEESQEKIAVDLLKRKLNLNKEQMGMTPLMAAAKHSRIKILNSLLKRKLNVNTTDYEGRTALSHAAGAGCLICVEALLKHKADPNIKDKSGKIPESYVGEAAYKNEILSALKNTTP